MRTYRAGLVTDPELRNEIQSIEQAANRADPFEELQILHAQPQRARPGMLVYADGSDWNPGSGPGLYRRDESNAQWVFQSDDGSFPEPWGGVGDGTTNDYTALTAARTFTSTPRLHGKTYAHGSVVAYGAASLLGQKWAVLKGPGASFNPGSAFYDCTIARVGFEGTGAAGETGIYINNGHRMHVEQVYATSYRNAGAGAASQGMRLTDAFTNDFVGIRIQDNQYGALIEGGSNNCSFFNCSFGSNDNHGALVRGSYAVSFISCDFEYNNDGLVLSNEVDAGPNAAECRTNGAIGCYFEGNTRSHIYIGPAASGTVRHAYVVNCYADAGTTDYGIIVDHSDSAYIGENFLAGTFGVARIFLKANSRNTTILNFPRWDVIALAPALVAIEAGATVSDQTIQHGYDVPFTTDASGNGYVDMTFTVPYESGHPPLSVTFYSHNDGLTGAVPFVCSYIPPAANMAAGFRVRVFGGPASTTFYFRWRAGA